MSINWAQLFPTKWSIVIFVLYIFLFVNQGMLVTASQTSKNAYEYDVVTVVLVTEFVKLLISTMLYCKDHSVANLFQDALTGRKVLILYFVPAFLYCLYNNLSFVNLSSFDPTTYYLLLQLRVVITAILFQIIFKKHLSKLQWFSLVLLTIGCMVKQVDFNKYFLDPVDPQPKTKLNGFHLDISALLILFQAVCSCLAGVYNEYLLKETGVNVNIYLQNIFMYIDSVVCNAILLGVTGKYQEALTVDKLGKLLHYKVILVMINNAAIGIITSFFLKNLNSILKTFASALELIFTAIFAFILFSIPIHINTVLSICLVLYATYLYSQNPVSNPPSSQKPHKSEESLKLVENMEQGHK